VPEGVGGNPKVNLLGAVEDPVFLRGTSKVYGSKRTALRRVGDLLETADDVVANPILLSGKSPADVQIALGKSQGWRVESLGKGSRKGKGWVFREYTPKGDPTGRSIRWHPGSGHHGPEPYWRVTGGNYGKSDIIR
jgi:hypothetical protein